MEIVTAVSAPASFSGTIARSLSASSRSADIGMQSSPRPCVIMKFTASGVTLSAAMTKSPSFSRSGASTTMTISPRAMASTACSIEANISGTGFSVASVTAMPFSSCCSL